MKATFIGVPGEQHDSIYMYGQVFPLGKAVHVDNPLGQRKLSKHPHFTSTEEASDEVEDVQIKREFSGAAEAVLAPIEEEHQAKAESATRKAGRPRKG